MKSLNYFI